MSAPAEQSRVALTEGRYLQLVQHLELRVADLQDRERRRVEDATSVLAVGDERYAVAATLLRDAAAAREARRELQRVLEVLR